MASLAGAVTAGDATVGTTGWGGVGATAGAAGLAGAARGIIEPLRMDEAEPDGRGAATGARIGGGSGRGGSGVAFGRGPTWKICDGGRPHWA